MGQKHRNCCPGEITGLVFQQEAIACAVPDLIASKHVLWEPMHGKATRGARRLTYVDVLKEDTGYASTDERRPGMLDRVCALAVSSCPRSMMEHRKALTISLTVDKDTSMGNPLKLPKSGSSPERGKLSDQINCANVAEYKVRYPDTKHRKETTLFDHNQRTMIRLGLASKNPCVILQDVLKTEQGRAYLGRKRYSRPVENGAWLAASQKTNGQRHPPPSPIRRGQRSDPREEEEKRRAVPSQSYQKSLTSVWKTKASASHRVPELHNTPSPGERASPALCPRRWAACDSVAPPSARRSWALSRSQQGQVLKRRNSMPEGHCNGAAAVKDPRRSVLRLPGEGKPDGEEPFNKRLFLSESRRAQSQARGPVRISVGGQASVNARISPSGSPSGAGKSTTASPGLNQDNSGPSDPIVLSSDESEAGEPVPHCHPVIHPSKDLVEAGSLKKAPKKDVVAQEEDTDPKVVKVVVDDFPGDILSAFIVSSISSQEYSCMTLSFYALRSGCYKGHANGNIMIQGKRLLIPLKASSSKLRVLFAVEFKELRRYSLWEQSELQARGLHVYDEHHKPPMFLLLLVSYTQAVAAQTLLLKLSGQQRTDTLGQVSPFLLLSLRTRLEGVEVAVLRSALEIASLNNLAQLSTDRPLDLLSELDDIQTPDLSLDSSLELIRRTGLDPQLLSLLGVQQDSPDPDPDPPVRHPEPAGLLDLHIQVCDPKTGLLSELNTAMDIAEARPEPESTKRKEENACPTEVEPVYTICHRQEAGPSYTVSLAKPDASWTKFKHQGLSRRLIQFPPPPSKGGITVTMEDLQCLDSGQYLNDVIIDFYLKYLLHNAPAAVAKRSHVFSSFFYKQLTRRDNASEDSTGATVSQSLRRHQRVKTWTRHVDIFQKDFLFVPVNQEAHWYLVVICFPGLEEPLFECRTEAGWQKTSGDSGSSDPQIQEEVLGPPESNVPTVVESASSRTDKSDGPTENVRGDATDNTPPGPPFLMNGLMALMSLLPCRPCILIMDSLKLSLHERIFKIMREYLQSEWEVRRGSVRDFSAEQMKGAHCRVPLQDNCSDCGLYLLQYVESFLKDPVLHFDLPLRLERWFPRQQVRRKRDQIRDLVLYLYRRQQQQQLKPVGAT
ncbi:Sentrin-specific protease 7 [Merluccius polli]|uniref:Sentrin-specific protease 7 n=1 Tax=Merluccius polli TaxID=89951 RepID=A0AA47PBM3_MERPO|nr:Sentrin-specific protease 7 [Merluccius polli]